jgi:hypothetical protein
MSLLGVFTVKFHDESDNRGFCDKDFSFEAHMARNIVTRWNELWTACTAHQKQKQKSEKLQYCGDYNHVLLEYCQARNCVRQIERETDRESK